ncbi:hypothetical protein [Sporisorium scitamineum]|uniref:GATOR1 complex protein NPRL3 C-terminal HTH domain-containing protein n=1 Tax=Sporisorium scitamineum TaxID=49012 RepID=A0A0F7S2D1_9BASI|nr:hypothetical protein [Sporisorium scitamineum]
MVNGRGRPPVLAHPDSVAEAALAAAAIAGSDSAAAAAASDKVPIPIAPRPQFDELKFERRPVLRSRSPSTAMMATGTSTGLSVSFSNLSERGEIGRRARADTTGSSSSGGGLAHGRNRSDGLNASQRSSKNNSASSSSSSSSDESSSDLSLSSDTDTDSSDTDSSPHHLPHRRKNHHHHHTSPILSSSISPSSSPRFSRTRTATHTTSAEHVYKESLIVEPSRASRRENEYIATMIEGKDSATVKHFFRLLPYLNGKHTVDEIEYRVGMRRRDIRRLLVTFREFIITFMHP